jgi:DNA-binding NtrC family response regulator
MQKPDLILLALEEYSILYLMDRVLRAVNYDTATAQSVQSLGKILKESAPSLLLIGEKFDGHEGLKIARELQERFPIHRKAYCRADQRPFSFRVERVFIASTANG